MGIHGFHTWVNESFPNVSPILNNYISVEHLYIDINFCLHIAVSKSNNLETLLGKLKNLIDTILEKIIPTKSITFASDGPAPYAKLLLQRERRFATARDINEKIDKDTINSLCFTPGTTFMDNLSDHLDEYVNNVRDKYNVNVYLLLDGPDEAEFKLIRQLLSNNDTCPSDRHLIVSNDADVCVMSAFLKCYKNVYVFVRLKHDSHLFNVGEFVYSVKGNTNDCAVCPNLDVGTIMLFMGNDYIPKVYYSGFNRIIKSYRLTVTKRRSGLVNADGKINTSFLKDFMMSLSVSIENMGFIKKFSITTYNPIMYDNYMKGVLWCIGCYRSGSYCDYDYMYKHKSSPHPLGILQYAFDCGEHIDYKPILNSVPISSDIYACIVLPKKAQNLFNSKLLSQIEKKNKSMYDEENCPICKEYRESITNFNKTIDYMSCIGEDYTCVKKKNQGIIRKYALHREIHKSLTYEDIKKIILDLKK